MSFALSGITLAALYVVLCVVLNRWADRKPEADEHHYVTTDDGWILCLHRFHPHAEGRDRRPLILGHGLMMNRGSWQLCPEGSMIDALCDAGYDVFVAEYRGSRSSKAPTSIDDDAFWSYSIEEHAYKDLPAIINGVRAITSSDTVHWVGHSMGGILIYLYGARFGCDHLARVVTLGSPVVFSKLVGLGPTLSRLFRRLTPWRKVFRSRSALACVLPFIALFPFLVRIVINPKNLDLRSRLTLVRGATEDISTQLADWFLMRIPRDASASLLEGPGGNTLSSFHAPLLIVAGARDLLAPPDAIHPAFTHAASTEKQYLLLDGQGIPEGAPVFGHSDMPSSPAAVRHLSPLIVDWLQAREDRGADVSPSD
jgi:pimeloyl-ACP methyl ester carboxylesterase